MILNFPYVCQSVSWLTFLLKLHKYWDIASSGWYIFLNFFGGIPGMLVPYIPRIWNFLYVCQSASWLTSLLKLDKYRDISSSGWNIFLNFFGDIPWDVCTLVPNNCKFLVCLSVWSLPHFITEIMLTVDIYSSRWTIVHIFSWDIPYMFVN